MKDMTINAKHFNPKFFTMSLNSITQTHQLTSKDLNLIETLSKVMQTYSIFYQDIGVGIQTSEMYFIMIKKLIWKMNYLQ